MSSNLRFFLGLTCFLLAMKLTGEAATVNATWNSATDVPVSASSYTATGNTLNFTLNHTPATGANLTVVNNTGLPFISGTFDNLSQGQAVVLSYGGTNYTYVANYYDGTGNDLVLVWASHRLFAWGNNGSGQLGDSSTTQRNLPVPVAAAGVLAGKTILAVAAGATHSLALCSDGTLAAWGDNTSGQLGNNSTTASTSPVAVSRAAGVSALSGKTVIDIAACGDSSMALCSDGTVVTWGNNSVGQLGNGSSTASSVPLSVTTSGVLSGKSVVAISAGNSFCLALCSDGVLATWGGNANGQLGNNSTSNRRTPVLVEASSASSALYGKSVVAMAAGWDSSLALCSDGTLVGWGHNGLGELGDNTSTQRLMPVAVSTAAGSSALSGRTAVSMVVANGFSLALCSDGAVLAWGSNTDGHLGINNNTSQSLLPVLVNTASGVSALYGKTVAALGCGTSHGAARCTDGSLTTWGNNFYGQLGVNNSNNYNVPKAVVTTPLNAGEAFVSISSSANAYHVLAVAAAPALPPFSTALAASSITYTTATLNGSVNSNLRTTTCSFDYGLTTAYGSTVTAAPASFSGSTTTAVSAPVTGLTIGTTYHYRVRSTNDVGTTTSSDLTFTTSNNVATLSALTLSNGGVLSPTFSPGTTSYTASVPSAISSIALLPTLTDGNASVKVNGVAVASGSASASLPLSAGSNVFSVAVTAQDGTTAQTYTVNITRSTASTVPVAFGSANDVPLTLTSFSGTGSTVNFTLNYAPATGANLTVVNNTSPAFVTGTFDNLLQGQAVTLSYNGIAYDYVANYYGGTGNDLVLVWARNRVFAWGLNGNYELGDTTTNNRSVPVPVTATGVLTGKTIISLATGSFHSLALCSDGTLAAWGYNSKGEVGDGTSTERGTPVLVNTASGVSALYGKKVVAISAGISSSMALCSDGTVAAWGYNVYGQLGDNTNTDRSVPVAVYTTNGVSALYGKSVVAICSGSYHNVALCSDGTIATWGSNSGGQLGDNTNTDRKAPVMVSTVNGTSALYGRTVVSVMAGGDHCLALCNGGTLAAWGYNTYGQLGDNTTSNRNVPVLVNTAGGTSALYGRTPVAIAVGQRHDLALCSDGSLVAWGYNAYGQLGDLTTTNRSAPMLVNAVSGVSSLYGRTVTGLACGLTHSAALCADGSLSAWGDNTYGQLGINSFTQNSPPILVITTPLAAGESFANAVSGPYSSHTLGLVVAPSAPAAGTLAATAISSTSVTLNGMVNAGGSSTTVSFEYGLSASYGLITSATPSSLSSSSSATAVSSVLTGLSPKTTYHFRAKGVSGAGAITGQDLTFTTLTLQQGWRLQNFGTSANSGAAADTADYDNDGICNLIEYALNLSPIASSKLPASAAMNGGNFEYTYTRSTAAVNAGTAFVVEWSPSLSSATWSSSGVTQNVVSDDGTTQQVKAVIPVNSAKTKFVHLSVTAPP